MVSTAKITTTIIYSSNDTERVREVANRTGHALSAVTRRTKTPGSNRFRVFEFEIIGYGLP